MQQQPRTLLAIVLSMLVIFVYYTWINPPVPPTPQKAPFQATPQENQPVEKPVATNPNSPEVLLKNAIPPPPDTELFVLQNTKIKAILSSQGAVFSSWELDDYHVGASQETPHTDLFKNSPTSMPGAGFYVTTGLKEIDESSQLFKGRQVGSEQVEFTWEGEGLRIKKIVWVPSDTSSAVNLHWVDLSVEITNTSSTSQNIDPRVWIKKEQKPDVDRSGLFSFLKPPVDLVHPMSFIDGSLKSDMMMPSGCSRKEPPTNQEATGKVYWAGLTDRYFLTTLVARQEGNGLNVRYGKLPSNEVYTSLSYGTLELRPGDSVTKKYSAYFGPKKREDLRKLGFNLEKSVDYGWFGIVAIPILWLLFFFHKILANWGLSIIVLTFFIKLLLHPVNVKAMASMKEMQKIQPELAKIREKFANDKERLNMEMMELFKRHKVNPMGGCLPMLLQMPIYIALYNVLYNAIELYHAPFYGFYKDLSAPDPYMILPIFLGLFMVLQQKLTPSPSADPMQQKMMTIMPIMFTGFMLFLPSGLVLYILVNTVMSVIQQYMMHKDVTGMDLLRKVFKKA